MAYNRCQCKIGDIPHPTEAQHKRQHSRCTRMVTHRVRRTRDTNGRSLHGAGPWYEYCAECTKAIRAYQSSDVEVEEIVQEERTR